MISNIVCTDKCFFLGVPFAKATVRLSLLAFLCQNSKKRAQTKAPSLTQNSLKIFVF